MSPLISGFDTSLQSRPQGRTVEEVTSERLVPRAGELPLAPPPHRSVATPHDRTRDALRSHAEAGIGRYPPPSPCVDAARPMSRQWIATDCAPASAHKRPFGPGLQVETVISHEHISTFRWGSKAPRPVGAVSQSTDCHVPYAGVSSAGVELPSRRRPYSGEDHL